MNEESRRLEDADNDTLLDMRLSATKRLDYWGEEVDRINGILDARAKEHRLRAKRMDEIYENVLEAMQDADEIGGCEGYYYETLMTLIALAVERRQNVFKRTQEANK